MNSFLVYDRRKTVWHCQYKWKIKLFFSFCLNTFSFFEYAICVSVFCYRELFNVLIVVFLDNRDSNLSFRGLTGNIFMVRFVDFWYLSYVKITNFQWSLSNSWKLFFHAPLKCAMTSCELREHFQLWRFYIFRVPKTFFCVTEKLCITFHDIHEERKELRLIRELSFERVKGLPKSRKRREEGKSVR